MKAGKDIDQLLAAIDTPEGKARVRAAIWEKGGPVYGTDREHPGYIFEIRADGSRRWGKFVDRVFVPM